MKIKKNTFVFAASALTVLLAAGLPAAEVSFSKNGPKPGKDDISNFTGTTAEGANVENGDHEATYIADDRPSQGQTFTTGTNSVGYQLRAVALREVKRETYALVPDLTYTI